MSGKKHSGNNRKNNRAKNSYQRNNNRKSYNHYSGQRTDGQKKAGGSSEDDELDFFDLEEEEEEEEDKEEDWLDDPEWSDDPEEEEWLDEPDDIDVPGDIDEPEDIDESGDLEELDVPDDDISGRVITRENISEDNNESREQKSEESEAVKASKEPEIPEEMKWPKEPAVPDWLEEPKKVKPAQEQAWPEPSGWPEGGVSMKAAQASENEERSDMEEAEEDWPEEGNRTKEDDWFRRDSRDYYFDNTERKKTKRNRGRNNAAGRPDVRGTAWGGQRRGRRRPGKIVRLILSLVKLLIMLVLVLFVARLFTAGYCVKPEITVEAGDKCPKVEQFLKWKNKNAKFVSDINEETVLEHPGDYGVVIEAYGKKSASVIHVKDTTAPEVVTKELTVNINGSVEPDAFIEEITDKSDVSVRFKEAPDFAKEGNQTVILEVEDESGNIAEADASLIVISDSEPPKISGVKELTMTVGSSVSYKKGVKAVDDRDGEVEVQVDTSAVDTKKVGNYEVVYKAVDAAGNEAVAKTTLHVKRATSETVTEEMINAEADTLLASILTDSMSEYDKAKAIYWWCHDHIAYSDNAPKSDWVHGAYQGLVQRRGDCYTYAASAKCLLTRANIKNMDIERIPSGNLMHYWNIIDIGEGWHHFDTCRRADGSTFFYKNDAEIKKYSDGHNGTHNYDRSKYPEIP